MLNPGLDDTVTIPLTPINVYEYLQANALFYGIDLSGSHEFTAKLSGYLKGSIIRARNTENDSFFPFIPSDRMDWGLAYRLNGDGKTHKLTLSNLLVARQQREPDFDLAPVPPGYALFNFAYLQQLQLGENKLNLGLQVQNIFNTSYKEYMNRFRYFTDDIGRNILLKINYQF